MSDTVKLIIEIPRIEYEQTCNLTLHNRTFYDEAIRNGTPLDSNSEKAEVQAYFDGQAYGWEQGRKALIDDVKAEIEDQKKWLSEAGYNAYNVDIAFSSIRNCIGRQHR